MSGVALVQFSSLNLGKYLPLGRQALDRSLSEKSDAAGHEPPLHHMLCVTALKSPNEKASPLSCRPYLNLFHAGFLVVADDRDFIEILELAGLPCVITETVERNVSLSFISGTLDQWQTALLRGCQKAVSREVRHTYNLIYREFKSVGLEAVFDLYRTEHPKDQTFLLEYKGVK